MILNRWLLLIRYTVTSEETPKVWFQPPVCYIACLTAASNVTLLHAPLFRSTTSAMPSGAVASSVGRYADNKHRVARWWRDTRCRQLLRQRWRLGPWSSNAWSPRNVHWVGRRTSLEIDYHPSTNEISQKANEQDFRAQRIRRHCSTLPKDSTDFEKPFRWAR